MDFVDESVYVATVDPDSNSWDKYKFRGNWLVVGVSVGVGVGVGLIKVMDPVHCVCVVGSITKYSKQVGEPDKTWFILK